MIKGYTVGSFDLFHVGHLRFLTQCRKRCDLLYVGVNADGMALADDKPAPIIPDSQRAEILQGLRCVAGAWVESDIDKMVAWRWLKFDVLFVGTDWKGTDHWNGIERQFAGTGVKVVYVPYTEGVSSSLIRARVKGGRDG